MNPGALSLTVYGLYLLVNGIGLAAAPSVLLALLALPPTEDPWVRLFGIVAAEVGFYFLYAARKGITSFYPATVIGRGIAIVVFVAFVVFRVGPTQLLVFAAVDLVTAIWTQLAIKGSRVN